MSSLRRLTRFDWAWISWLVSGLVVEALALRNQRQSDTFSEGFWWLSGNADAPHRYARIVRVVLLCASAWLIVHLFARRGWV